MKNLMRSSAAKRLQNAGFTLIPIKYTFQGLPYGIGFDIQTEVHTGRMTTGKNVSFAVEPKAGGVFVGQFVGRGGSFHCKTRDLWRLLGHELGLIPIIEFLGDHAQYFQPRTKDGYTLFIGAGENERAAFKDAAEQAYGSECHTVDRLPKKAGDQGHGIAYHFGKETAREHRGLDDSELHVYCLLYMPEK